MAQEQNVKLVITGENRSRAAINQAKGGMDSLISTAKKFAIAAGVAFAVKKVVDFGQAAFDAFREAEVATAKVNAIVQTLNPNLGITTAKIQEMAKAAINLGFSDEAAAQSLAVFAQRTKDLTKAQELNALAMDLARAKNIDLEQAANLVGQVLSGNARVLKQFGIEIDETLGPMAALGELQEKVRGQAEAFADTTEGKLTILSERWGEVKETAGAALAEGITPFIEKLLDFVSKPETIFFFEALAETVGKTLLFAFKQLTEGNETLINIFVKMFEITDKLSTFFKETFVASINFVTETFNNMKSGVLAIVEAFESVINAASRAGSAVGGVVSGAAKKISGKRASGGPVSGGSSYLVGEEGPEIFSPKSSGNIIPNRGLATGGMVLNINITGNTLLDSFAGEKIADQIMRTLKMNFRI